MSLAPPGCDVQPSVLLLPARIDDGAALAGIRARAMRPSLEAVGRFDAERVRHRFLDSFDPQYTRKVVVADALVGVVVVRPVDDHFLLDHLYMEPACQGAGIGSVVLGRVIQEARAAARLLRVGALKQSRSNHFYLRHGFTLESQGEWDNYYVLPPGAA